MRLTRSEPIVVFNRPAAPLGRVQRRYRGQLQAKLADGTYGLETVTTCLCGAGNGVIVARNDRFGVPVAVLACHRCGLLRTSPRLAASNLPAFYDEEYHGLHFGVANPDAGLPLVREGQGARIYRFCRPWLEGPVLNVAEVGAGSGTVLRELQAEARSDGRAATVWGCEYSSTFAQVAQSLGTDVRQGGIETLQDGPGRPDLLVLSHVVEHLPDPLSDLVALRDLLTPTSVVYVEVPGVLSIHRRPEYAYRLVRYLTLAHLYHFTLDTLTDLMHRAGYERLAGDEEVRAVFRLSRTAGDRVSSPGLAHAPAAGQRFDDLMRYLTWLERSPGVRFRRGAVEARDAIRRPWRSVLRRALRSLRRRRE